MKYTSHLPLGIVIPLFACSAPLQAAESMIEQSTCDKNTSTAENQEEMMVVTAIRQNLQAPGVSATIAEEIRRHPPARDVSELIRTQPGVSLIGNFTSGQRDSNQQIDIRGMGPESTLILIDGKPVTSRNSVWYDWCGGRDSRGDTSQVPTKMIDHIDMIRGPATACYGNGVMGGIVNIVTKPTTLEWHRSWNTYANVPQHHKEGATERTNFSLNGSLSDSVSFNFWGNLSKTQAGAQDINAGYEVERTGSYAGSYPAGREEVVNKDIHSRLCWEFASMQALEFEAGYSRQGNLYVGDTQNTSTSTLVKSMYGKEANHLYRQTYGVTWTGGRDNDVTSNSHVQYEHTHNSRINEGLAGGTEGIFSSGEFLDIDLADVLLHSEVNIPFMLGADQNPTLGTEWNQQWMKDGVSTTQALSYGTTDGMSAIGHSPYSSAEIFSLFTEDNMALTGSIMLISALRFDHHGIVGNNWNPSLNLSQESTGDWTPKLGIARVYKAFNLYQLNLNYILYSNGQGCYASSSACYLMENSDLKAETSVSKEIGLKYKHDGYQAGITWFHNDYHNKIESGYAAVGTISNGTTNTCQWESVPKVLVEGLEGTLNLPVGETVNWSNNLTWMLQSKNKTTGDWLSVVLQFTLNSTLSWQVREDLFLQSTFTWYGRQEPKRFNYKGEAVNGSELNEVSPYSTVGLSATWDVNKNLNFISGIDDLFDIRHYRAGNAQTTDNATTGAYLYGADAETYNESGRIFFMSVNTHFWWS